MSPTRRLLVAGGLALAAAGSPAPAPGAPPALGFERIDLDVGAHTSDVVALHLDGDPVLDLVAVGDGRLVLLRGRGDGRFDPAGSVDAGANAVGLASADLDGDGLADLVVANHATDHVTVLFADGDAGYQARGNPRLRVGVSPHPHAVRLGDVDGDGHADLLVDDRDAEALKLFLGSGHGRFEAAPSVPVGGDPYRGMFLGDLGADDVPDLLTPNPDHVAVLRGAGDGAFLAHAALRPGFAPFSVTAGDFDGDGRVDIAAGSGEGRGMLTVWFSSADGTFRPGDRHALAAGPTTLAAADLDGDRVDELIATSWVGAGVAVRSGGEAGRLLRLDVPGHPYGIATGDFDGDGRGDFAIANDGANQVGIFLSRTR